jgi:nucleotide-binding universal stress UspA family protein
MTKKRVLIPLDGSEFSRQVMQVVRDYFKPQEVELVLLRVALPLILPMERVPAAQVALMTSAYETYAREEEQNYQWTAQEQEAYRTQLQEELQTEAAHLGKIGYQVATEVLFGDPAQRISDYVKEAKIDLVAMTTHGRTGWGRFVLGSVAERVLRTVDVPVLLLRTVSLPVEKRTPGQELLHSLSTSHRMKIVVATDGSTFGQQAVKQTVELAETLRAQLTVLVIVSEHDSIEHNQQVMGETVNLLAQLQPKPQLVPLVGYTD